MGTVKIADLPSANTIEDTDYFVLDQKTKTTKTSVQDFISSTLTIESGASKIGTSSGETVEYDLNILSDNLKTLSTEITPEMFYSGTITDHTEAIKLAINSAITQNKKLKFNSGIKYYISSQIKTTLNNGNILDIDFNNADITYPGSIVPWVFQNTLVGSINNVTSIEEVSYNLSVTGSTNSRVSKIYAPGHNFTTLGEIGRIFSDDIVDDSDGSNQFKAEYFVVGAVDGDYIITSGVLFESYSINIKVCKPSNAKLILSNINFSSTLTASQNSASLTMTGFILPTIFGNCRVKNLNGPFLNITCCYMANFPDTIVGENIKNSTADGAFGYLVNDSMSYGTYINCIQSINSRHPYTTSTGGSSSGVVAGDNRWDLRGRTAFSYIDTIIGEGDGCTFDTHATAYKINVGKIIALNDPRGDNVGGVGVQIRANSVRIDSIESHNCKTGIFVSGATKTSQSFISIGQARVYSKQGCLPVNIQGSSTYRIKCIIDNLEFFTEHDSVIYVTNAKLIVKYLSGEFTPYLNGGELVEADTGAVVDILDGDIYINSGNSHSLGRHSNTETTIRAKLRCSGMNLVSYLASSASQYDIQSEWDVHLDTWTGTPFLGLPATNAKAFAKIRVGSTSYPLRYRALTYATSGSQSINLQNSGDDVIVLRTLVTEDSVVIGALTKGAFPGQEVIVSNHTNSTFNITIANSSSNLLSLGSAVVISPGSASRLYWDGSTWRRGS